jgi:hypothetical protein
MGKAAKLQRKAITLGLLEAGVGGAHSSKERLGRIFEPRSPGVKQADSERHGTD